MIKSLMRKFGLATALFLCLAGIPGSLWACPSCAGSVPWTDGVEGEEEGVAYNRTIGLMLAAPAFMVCAVALVSRKNHSRRDSFMD